jgi:radical SAM protein with 4Fe4S-binding SPASM domain
MGNYVVDYSKHGDINEYIHYHHKKKHEFAEYREKWKDNINNELLFVLLETLSKCNLKCPMCVHSVGYPQTPRMTDKLFEIVVENLRNMNVPSVCMNQINEPLLDRKIIARIKSVSEIDSVVDIHMNTNAILLTEETSLALLNSGLTRLLIGFDAYSSKTYAKMRKTNNNNYDIALSNILRFIDLKKKHNKVFPLVRISFVTTSINEDEESDWFDYWKDKVDYLSVQRYQTPVLDDSKDFLIGSYKKEKQKEKNKQSMDNDSTVCNQPFNQIVIRGDGSVLPCCSQIATGMELGNIEESSLHDLWNGQYIENLRRELKSDDWKDNPVCSKCLSTNSQ